jgi:hypothetical protein
LIAWAQALWPDDPPVNLTGVAALVDRARGRGADRIVEQIRGLERRLYAPDSGAWRGGPLWQAVQDGTMGGSDKNPSRGGRDALAPLYPRRG